MVSKTLRDTVRAIYGFRCGYCGVTEEETIRGRRKTEREVLMAVYSL